MIQPHIIFRKPHRIMSKFGNPTHRNGESNGKMADKIRSSSQGKIFVGGFSQGGCIAVQVPEILQSFGFGVEGPSHD